MAERIAQTDLAVAKATITPTRQRFAANKSEWSHIAPSRRLLLRLSLKVSSSGYVGGKLTSGSSLPSVGVKWKGMDLSPRPADTPSAALR
jgi:hypothetical protein